MIDDEFKALLMHKIFFLFLCGQLWPQDESGCTGEWRYLLGNLNVLRHAWDKEIEKAQSEGHYSIYGADAAYKTERRENETD